MIEAVDRLIKPRSIAIIGASPDTQKLTGRPLAYLKKHGYRDRIYPVNPRYTAIGDYDCYPDVASLPDAPDVGLVLLGADRVIEAVSELSKRGAGAAIVLASGFSESGAEGHARQARLKEAAGSMRLLGPNTIGLVNVTDGIMLSASAALELEDISAGNIGLVSQSGGILGSLLSRAVGRGIGFSRLIATGNESDLGVSDFVDYLIDDEMTKTIALYLEGLRDPDRFRQVALRALAAGKPIVAFKVGRSESGIRSAVSHTGALAGSDRAYDALFKQFGVIRAQSFADLLDIPLALSAGYRLRGRRVAVVTSTGGAASLVADAVGLAGFDTPPPDRQTAAKLNDLHIKDAVLDRNPIDVTLAGTKPELLQPVIDAVIGSGTYDAVAVVVGSSSLHQPDLVTTPLLNAAERSDKPIVAYVSPEAPDIIRHLNKSGIPAFAAPESCATALTALRHAARDAPLPSGRIATPTPALTLRSGSLNETESKALFAQFGIRPTDEAVVLTAEQAEAAARRSKSPVVVKILSRDVLHKTEIGGVAVNVVPDRVAAACREMARRFMAAGAGKLEGFLVQEMISGGTEMLIGFSRDEQLGASILIGLGGVTTEIFKDTSMRLVPVSERDAREMIDELKSSVLLRGFRGRPKADVGALVSTIVAFSNMVEHLGEQLVEAEINPLFVLADGQGVRAADGVVVIRSDTPTAA
jgi:acetate---CoA ligase (ADP-forming)